jgi:hypothetical protein
VRDEGNFQLHIACLQERHHLVEMHKLLFLLAAIITAPLIGQPKPAWTWTVQERIAFRTDSNLARERVRNDKRVQAHGVPSGEPETQPWADQFNGQSHPELFLPHEVFDELVKLAFLGSPRTGQVVRKGFLPEIRRHGLPTDFWQQLESLSTFYFADYWAVSDLLRDSTRRQSGADRERAEESLVLKHTAACRSRAAALAAARKEFGSERFDRFLYDVIAVNMFSATDRLPDPELLRQAERGCP